MAAPAKVSKNQRAHPKQKPRVHHCAEGHELVRVLVVPVFGRRRFEWRCQCVGLVVEASYR